MGRSQPGRNEASGSVQRCGDSVEIGGDYQHRALREGNSIQRFWHYTKLLAIERLLPPGAGDTILDVGCGSGVISSFLGESGAHVLGIDANPDAVRFAEETYGTERVSFRVGLADRPLGPEGSVDKIYCLELLEHIHAFQAKTMLGNFYKLLKPGAKALLTTPNYRSMWPLIEWLMDRLRLAPHMAGEQHVELYHRKKLRAMCMESGFSLEHLGTVCFLAPWLAPLSWQGARVLAQKELAATCLPGSVLVCVLCKRG